MSVFILRKYSYFFFLFLYVVCTAQNRVTGIVLDQDSNPVPEASIQILELQNKGTVSDFDGKFDFKIPSGSYTLKTTFIGFKASVKKIVVSDSKNTFLTIVLQEDIKELGDVLIKGKSKVQKIKEKAFEVEVVQTNDIKNLSIDVNQALNIIPGVIIRESGGVGSNFEFSMNGLSGKQIKFFIDGVPMESFGSSITLNNFPANLIERAEVYKGVVPVYLGADALGGAVNIITNQSNKNYLDLSYDYGSFNTHRATLLSQIANTDKGFLLRLSSFFNHSDNNYEIDNIDIKDDLGNIIGKSNNVKRFHDKYTSRMIAFKTGLIQKKYADKLLIGIVSSDNQDQKQHSRIDIQSSYGELETENKVLYGSVEYEKKGLLKDKIDLSIYSAIGVNKEVVIDTSSNRYNWFGDIERNNNDSFGERNTLKSLLELKDDIVISKAHLKYHINTSNTVDIGYTKNYMRRQGTDAVALFTIPFEKPHKLDKNIVGLSYDFKTFAKKLTFALFTKGYFMSVRGVVENGQTNDEDLNPYQDLKSSFDDVGYGAAVSYKFSKSFQTKLSFEKTYRLPEGYEVFGDGFNIKPNINLIPEESYNINLGFLSYFSTGNFDFNFDSNFFYRDSKNFIRPQPIGSFVIYTNTFSAENRGVEAEFQTKFKNSVFLKINGTYQEIFDSSKSTAAKNIRIANIPYFFGNSSVGVTIQPNWFKDDSIDISVLSNYVHEYPYRSFDNGNEKERSLINEQLTHDLQISYAANKRKYNISFTAKNITDAQVYDNFNLQLPGRAFYVKLSYFLNDLKF
jgi:outer membrane receptor protein involved in Fe transport